MERRASLRWFSPGWQGEAVVKAGTLCYRRFTTKGTKGTKMVERLERLDAIGRAIVDSAIKVHKALGPGLLESMYEHCLAHELKKREIPFKQQLALPVFYDGERIDGGLRLDLLVDDCVIVEIKAVEKTAPIHQAQLHTYLKLTGLRLGYLINFNVRLAKDGIQRYSL